MEGDAKSGTSGRRLAAAIVLLGATAAVAAFFFREHVPRPAPATQPSTAQPG